MQQAQMQQAQMAVFRSRAAKMAEIGAARHDACQPLHVLLHGSSEDMSM
jgi:hypothetical protein